MDALSAILNKIHTTPMGAERIRRNLGIETDDVIAWCKDTILLAENSTLVITSRVGKNWYIYTTDIVVTINAYSYTIITAHKLKTIVRPMVESDCCVLDEFKPFLHPTAIRYRREK